MRNTFIKQVNLLKKVLVLFDQESNQLKFKYLSNISSLNLPESRLLISYFETLLFLCAYPADAKILAASESELARITGFIKRSKKEQVSYLKTQDCLLPSPAQNIHMIVYSGC